MCVRLLTSPMNQKMILSIVLMLYGADLLYVFFYYVLKEKEEDFHAVFAIYIVVRSLRKSVHIWKKIMA